MAHRSKTPSKSYNMISITLKISRRCWTPSSSSRRFASCFLAGARAERALAGRATTGGAMTEHVLILRQWRSLKACVLVLAASVLLTGAASAQVNSRRPADDKGTPQAAGHAALADNAD